jgi:hypothetical protein
LQLSQKETALSTIKATLSSVHNKELQANGQVFDKDMEIRKLKIEIADLKGKLEILTDEINFKKKESNDSKLELCELSAETKNLRNESVRKDKQITILKDKLQDLNLEVNSDELVGSFQAYVLGPFKYIDNGKYLQLGEITYLLNIFRTAREHDVLSTLSKIKIQLNYLYLSLQLITLQLIV